MALPLPPLAPTGETAPRVFQLSTKVSQYKKMVDVLGRERDTSSHRHKLKAWGDDIVELAKNLEPTIKGYASLDHRDRDGSGGYVVPGGQPNLSGEKEPRRFLQDHAAVLKRLISDYRTILADFQAAQRICAQREAMSLPKPDRGSVVGSSSRRVNERGDRGSTTPVKPPKKNDASSAERTRLLGDHLGDTSWQQEEQQQQGEQQQHGGEVENMSTTTTLGMTKELDNQINLQETIIAERDRGIREIQTQIHEVNEIFRDLAVLVADQGNQLEDIESAMNTTVERTEDARRQLSRAQRRQRNSGRWLCFLLVLFAGGMFFIGVALFG